MTDVSGGELFVRTIERAGVRELFTLHGGHLDAILQAAHDHGFRLIDTRHEQAAAHAAEGWARVTGRPGIAVVTAGPGITDAVTGVANAWMDAIPMLLIGGAAPLRDAETLPLQGGFDQVALFTPITKWAHRITHTNRIPDLVAHALRIATEGRPGPVYLEIPIDVLFAPTDEAKVFFPDMKRSTAAPAPTSEAVSRAIEILAAAERPVIIAGGGAFFSGAADALRAFAERTGIPVLCNGKAHGLVPADHPLCGGNAMNLAIAKVLARQATDTVLFLGARIGLFTGGRSELVIPQAARIIQVDVEAEEIGRNRNIELGVTADCREALLAFHREAESVDWPNYEAWVASIQQARNSHRMMFGNAIENQKAPIHPYQMAAAIARAVDRDAIIIADGGETAAWMEMVAEIHEPGQFHSHGYLGCLGVGLPFAIAAKLAHPDRQVVCLTGDGAVGLNFTEFDTMARHGLAITVVVNNDRQWGMSAHGQELLFGLERRVVSDLAPSRYDLAAQAFGCRGALVEEPGDLAGALEEALRSDQPTCLNVMTDPSVIHPITMAMTGGARSRQDSQGKTVIPYYDDLEG